MWRGVLGKRDFRRLFVASTVSGFGSWLLVMAVPVHVFALTGSVMSTGLTLAVEALPAIAVGPWAGVAVDRWPRGPTLVAANVVSAAGVALMALATTPDRTGLVYLGLLAENLAMCFVRPAVTAATPLLVRGERDLAAANALTAFANSAGRMLGPPLGTALVARGWFTAVVLVDAASYLLAAATLTGLTIATDRPTHRTARVTGQLRDGLRLVARTRLLRGLLGGSWAFWAANAALTTLLVPFATTRLHASGAAVGYLVAGLGIGYLCGSALSRALVARLPARVLLGVAYTAVGLCFLVLFTASALPVALAAVTASGIPGAVAQVATAHRLQASTPDATRGRVAAAFATSDAVAAVAGALTAPAIVALAGLDGALLALSGAVTLTGPLAALLLPSTVDRKMHSSA